MAERSACALPTHCRQRQTTATTTTVLQAAAYMFSTPSYVFERATPKNANMLMLAIRYIRANRGGGVGGCRCRCRSMLNARASRLLISAVCARVCRCAIARAPQMKSLYAKLANANSFVTHMQTHTHTHAWGQTQTLGQVHTIL